MLPTYINVKQEAFSKGRQVSISFLKTVQNSNFWAFLVKNSTILSMSNLFWSSPLRELIKLVSESACSSVHKHFSIWTKFGT